MTERLFVYGSLAPGRPNAHVLADLDGTWEPATVEGRLVPAGWGADLGFPGIVPAAGADTVRGQVFTSPGLGAHWTRVDAFEGEGYVRVQAPARLADGRVVDAWLYALADPPPANEAR